jgi:tRNA 2-thiouridine synthesizing protein B
MTLHTLSASPASPACADCLRLIAPGDQLLLLGDGVYAALPGTPTRARLDACGARFVVLREDAEAAGIAGRLQPSLLIDLEGFVELTESCPRQLAWY